MSSERAARTATLNTDEVPAADGDALPLRAFVADRYEVREVLGSGGYAVVYRAWDRELRSEVALKLLRSDRRSTQAFVRFRREVSVARDVISPRLVRVYDLGGDDGSPYLTMEVLPGGSLRRAIKSGGIAVADAIRLAEQMFEGLAALHRLNIVHRDIKPENVLIDANGDAKLADFGLARYLDEEHSRATVTGSIVGTNDYLSPEQALGVDVDTKSDLYSVGLVLFELLTGQRPFPRDSSVGSVLARLRSPAPSVRSIRREVPLWLASVVARLLQREPGARYASAETALLALRTRRADLRTAVPWRRIVIGSIAAAVVAAVIVVPQLFAPPPENAMRFTRVSTLDEHTIAAIGSKGETLWRRDDVDSYSAHNAALVRLQPHARPLLAIVLLKRYGYGTADRHTLSFVDPDSGEVRKQVQLPSGADSFPDYADRYYVSGVTAVDLDRDGIDEVIVSYGHVPEAPSYIDLYEPRLDRARTIFEGFGGHTFAAAQDLDGDGRPELLIMGINNDFDWMNAMAAIRVRPWVGETWNDDLGSVFSPERASYHDPDLLWYALLPRGQKPRDLTAFSFDSATKQITVKYTNGRKVVLTRDGFLAGEPSSYAPDVRNAFRTSAYVHYRECRRLMSGGFAAAAIQEIREGVEAATKANDRVLIEGLERAEGKTLILAGRMTEGEALFRRIAATSENASEVAYDAAVAFHLHGDLDRAVEWYERGFGNGAALVFGKSKHEFIQGIVFALTERGEFTRAEDAMRRFRESYISADNNWQSMYREFIRWRAGEMPKFDDIDVAPYNVDVVRYWKLEFRNRRGDDATAILKDVEQEIAWRADPRSGLMSLKAELLSRLGKPAEAAEVVRRVWEFSRIDRKSSIIACAHAALVGERLKRLAGVEAR